MGRGLGKVRLGGRDEIIWIFEGVCCGLLYVSDMCQMANNI